MSSHYCSAWSSFLHPPTTYTQPQTTLLMKIHYSLKVDEHEYMAHRKLNSSKHLDDGVFEIALKCFFTLVLYTYSSTSKKIMFYILGAI